MELVDRLKAKEKSAFDELYRNFRDEVYNVVFFITDDKQSAEDITHDTFLDAMKAIDQFRSESSLRTWLSSIATKKAIKHNRSHAVSRKEPEEEFYFDDLAIDDLIPVEQVINKHLPDLTGQIFVLHDVEGYTHEEISEKLHTTEDEIKKHLAKARETLREYLKE